MTIRFWVTVAICVIAMLIVYYIASDRITPMTRDAYVQAFVIPIAPLVSGEVTEVFVENGNQVKKRATRCSVPTRGPSSSRSIVPRPSWIRCSWNSASRTVHRTISMLE
ncbi:MAG: hypothetical protein GY933_07205 [Hyphomicrobiales bacterium]|nr:hypothetical protein [Hyphomicrobiales bacterium]